MHLAGIIGCIDTGLLTLITSAAAKIQRLYRAHIRRKVKAANIIKKWWKTIFIGAHAIVETGGPKPETLALATATDGAEPMA